MQTDSNRFWSQAWVRHIEEYLKSVPRAGIFLRNYFAKERTVLEVAGGSCRDSRYLAKKGFVATCSDFDAQTIKYLKEVRFPNDLLRYSVEDAFAFSYKKRSFDLVFHNGFFIYFDDAQIMQMLQEQARVAKHYIIFFVHNGENRELIETFRKRAQSDKLFDIRFFSQDECIALVKSSGIEAKRIKIAKFGGFFDLFYKKRFKGVIPNPLYPLREYIVPRLYWLQRWENTERICCIVELYR